jgi:hypothetical protein
MAIGWSGREEYHATGDHNWYYDADKTKLGGYARSASSTNSNGGSLSFLQVLEAGHMVCLLTKQ